MVLPYRRMRTPAASLLVLLGLAGLLLAVPAAARANDGFAAQLFEPSADPYGFVTVSGGKALDPLHPHVAAWYDFARRPLVLTGPAGSEATVDTLHWLDLVAGLGLLPIGKGGLAIGFDLPIALAADGTDPITDEPFDTSRVGDLRTDLKLAVLDRDDDVVGAGLRGWVDWPTGSESRFISNAGAFALGIEGFVEKRFGEVFRLGGTIAYEWLDGAFRSPNGTIDDWLRFGAAAAVAPLTDYEVWDGLEIIGEITHRTSAKRPWDAEGISPFEGTLAVRMQVPVAKSRGFDFLLGGGLGLNEGIGAPDARLIVSVGFTY
jgi:hypothetical protein